MLPVPPILPVSPVPPTAPTRPPRGPVSPAGFTLVEFLLVAALLAVGLLGLGELQVAAARGASRSRTRLAALILAGNALEAARFAVPADGSADSPAESPGDSPADAAPTAFYDRDGQPARAPSGFFTVRRVQAPPGAPGVQGVQGLQGLQGLQVTVSWMDDTAPARLTLGPGCAP